jgi:acetylglutamate kinase
MHPTAREEGFVMNYVVIKCGGSVFESLPASFYSNIVNLHQSGKWQPVIVHGGGPLISSLLKKIGIQTHFVNGLRVTTNEMLDIVEMVLSGSVNKQVVRQLLKVGGKAWGISGVDGELLRAKLIDQKLGFVGEVVSVNASLITSICKEGYIPVISPLGIDEQGQRYNINGDMAASAIAKALEAKLCLISDIPGIYIERDGQKEVLKQATKVEIEKLIEDEVITGGMIPKVTSALDGLAHGIPEVVILNGLEEDHLLQFCQGQKVGTKIVLTKEVSHV